MRSLVTLIIDPDVNYIVCRENSGSTTKFMHYFNQMQLEYDRKDLMVQIDSGSNRFMYQFSTIMDFTTFLDVCREQLVKIRRTDGPSPQLPSRDPPKPGEEAAKPAEPGPTDYAKKFEEMLKREAKEARDRATVPSPVSRMNMAFDALRVQRDPSTLAQTTLVEPEVLDPEPVPSPSVVRHRVEAMSLASMPDLDSIIGDGELQAMAEPVSAPPREAPVPELRVLGLLPDHIADLLGLPAGCVIAMPQGPVADVPVLGEADATAAGHEEDDVAETQPVASVEQQHETDPVTVAHDPEPAPDSDEDGCEPAPAVAPIALDDVEPVVEQIEPTPDTAGHATPDYSALSRQLVAILKRGSVFIKHDGVRSQPRELYLDTDAHVLAWRAIGKKDAPEMAVPILEAKVYPDDTRAIKPSKAGLVVCHDGEETVFGAGSASLRDKWVSAMDALG
ncbi:hypothetical protein J8273_7220 [Carpediemonas membranifera]|uniref:PH domain-containing protein n=1 Tax=Carpediemonas membranifera TaxID=201153 RepID=A0A8J6B1D3_9EUKA|nr:hypothetical protein J8273_7220 [Carpediemonas membranifera]|eukprot:KAG9390947.1 hypothetical protein J8273_7220 [Carpediemonas membranifera]